jgi:hypothetical protein
MRQCWGPDIIEWADEAKDISYIHEGLAAAKRLKDGSITAIFERQSKGKVTFMACQHTYKETRYADFTLSDAH